MTSVAKDLWPSYCGLNAIIPFNGTFSGEVCEGEVGDWDPETCTTRGTIVFRSNTCATLIFPQGRSLFSLGIPSIFWDIIFVGFFAFFCFAENTLWVYNSFLFAGWCLVVGTCITAVLDVFCVWTGCEPVMKWLFSQNYVSCGFSWRLGNPRLFLQILLCWFKEIVITYCFF